MQIEQLTDGNFYHIYNRGNNRMNLFSIPADYEHFLGLYDKYISPVADTLAWVLMPNHIHLMVRIKENVAYKYSKDHPYKINADRSGDAVRLIGNAAEWEKWFEEHKWETGDLSVYAVPDNVEVENKFNADRSIDAVGLKLKTPVPHSHFSHLFNAYTRYYHSRTGGCGNLFERPFKRKQVENEEYLKNVILYIHNNPVHHGFCSHPLEYSWSSYISCVSEKPTKLKREAVVKLFGNDQKFKAEHLKPVDTELMDKWLDVGIEYVTDLSAFAEPDNVSNEDNAGSKLKVEGDNNIEKADNNEDGNFNADRSGTLSGWRGADLSAFAEPDNVNEMNCFVKENNIES